MGDLWRLWLALGALLGVAERFTARLHFGPIALGALAGTVAAAVGWSYSVQAGAFAAVTTVGLALRGTLLASYQRAAVRRGGIVRSATVTEPVSDHAGRVRYAGREWRALSSGQFIPPGTKVTVTGLADETTLRVYPKEVVQQAVTMAQREPPHRVSWREASKARGKLSGGDPLTPEERLRLANVSHQRWRYIDRLWGRVMVSFVGLMSAVILALSPLGLVPAIRAAQGTGVRGIFTAQTMSCSRTCQWTGTFTSAGQIVHGVVYDDAPGLDPRREHGARAIPGRLRLERGVRRPRINHVAHLRRPHPAGRRGARQ